MSPEENQLLQKIAVITEENRDILRRMQRSRRWSALFKVIYWLLVFGAAFGAYYALQPYLKKVQDVYGGLQQNVEQVKKIGGAVNNFGNAQF